MKQRIEFSHKEIFGKESKYCVDCNNDTCHICHKQLGDEEMGYYCDVCYTKLHPSIFDYDDN